MKKTNLTEEIYRMRKLMGYDSKNEFENITTYERLMEERLVKKFKLREADEEPPKFFDWSRGGKVNWENAKLNDILTYIEEVDKYFGGSFLTNPSYTTMIDWYTQNDSDETRESLKKWLFGDIYYGITKTEGVKQTKKNVVAPDEYDDNLQSELTTIMDTASKLDLSSINVTDSKLKKSIDTIKSVRTLEKLNKEFIAINKANVKLKKEQLQELKDNLNYLIEFSKNPKTDTDSIDQFESVVKFLIDLKLDKEEFGIELDSDEVKIGTSPEQRIAIKNDLMKKLSTEIESVGEDTYKKLLKKITNITITDNPKELNQFKVSGQDQKPIPVMEEGDSDIFQYPPDNLGEGERNTLSNNFFPDDGTSMSSDAIDGIRAQIRELKKFISEQEDEVNAQRQENGLGEEFSLDVSSINIFVYSSTSKVRTTYKSKDKTFSENNNIKLAEDRSTVIENTVRNILNDLDLGDYNIILASRVEKPNIGPGWLKLDGKYADGSDVPITSYGELFQKAYEKDKSLTPQMFYGNRTSTWSDKATKRLGTPVSQQQLAQEYNDIYGPFRMNLAGISVTLKKPKLITKEEVGEDYFVVAVPGMGIELQSNGEFSFKDTWNNLKRGIKKLKRKTKKILRSLKPKRRFFGKLPDFSKVCQTCCPKW